MIKLIVTNRLSKRLIYTIVVSIQCGKKFKSISISIQNAKNLFLMILKAELEKKIKS